MAATATAREISAVSPVICVTADHCARTSDAAPAVHIHDPFRGQRRVDRIEDLMHLVRRLWNADVTNRERSEGELGLKREGCRHSDPDTSVPQWSPAHNRSTGCDMSASAMSLKRG